MRRVGAYWEQQAELYLQGRGLTLVSRNFLTHLGEIDLIMHDSVHLVFVEVRYRRSSRFASAAGTVTPQKRARLTKCANLFRKQHPNWSKYPCRFDVIAYDASVSLPDAIWLRGAFEATTW